MPNNIKFWFRVDHTKWNFLFSVKKIFLNCRKVLKILKLVVRRIGKARLRFHHFSVSLAVSLWLVFIFLIFFFNFIFLFFFLFLNGFCSKYSFSSSRHIHLLHEFVNIVKLVFFLNFGDLHFFFVFVKLLWKPLFVCCFLLKPWFINNDLFILCCYLLSILQKLFSFTLTCMLKLIFCLF